MNIIEFAIVVVLIYIAVIDYRERIIQNWSLLILIVLGIANKLIRCSLMISLVSLFGATMLFFFSLIVGYFYYYKKGVDVAGGGDYKFISALACVFNLEKLLMCFIVQFIFEFIIRHIIYPKKKYVALPLGASLGIISAIILVGGI